MNNKNFTRQKLEWFENESLNGYLRKIKKISELCNCEYTIITKIHK